MTWRCFHCDEVFTTVDDATNHFGPAIYSDPACTIDAARLRELEAELARHRQEDTDLHREIHRLQSEHLQALLREEEKGYARGLADARTLSTRVIELLLDVAYRAFLLCDDATDIDAEGLSVAREDFDALSDALDKLDELPDDQPGIVMGTAAKARWALRDLIGIDAVTVPENDQTGETQ